MAKRNLLKTQTSEINRAELDRCLNRLQNGLNTTSYLPILSYICFDGDIAFTYNDIFMVCCPNPTKLTCAVPGPLLVKYLATSQSKVSLTQNDVSTVQLKIGNKNVTDLLVLSKEHFLGSVPDVTYIKGKIPITEKLLSALEFSLLVAADQKNPDNSIIHIDSADELLQVYVHGAETDCFCDVELDGDAPNGVWGIQPQIASCVLAIATSIGKPDGDEIIGSVSFSKEWIRFQFDEETTVYAKTSTDSDLADQAMKEIETSLAKARRSPKIEIPKDFMSSIDRVNLFIDPIDDLCQMDITKNEILLTAKYQLHGQTTEHVDGGGNPISVRIKPQTLKRALSFGTHMQVSKSSVLVTGDSGKVFLLATAQ